MRSLFVLTTIFALCLSGTVRADVFNLGSGVKNLDMVTVGDAGNAADTRYGGYGSVDYTYNIGKYEVTSAQYADFLNNVARTDTYGLYNSFMADSDGCGIQRSGSSSSYSYAVANGWADKPVNYVSYWDACRFANWLDNGQGSGDTESGAYTLNGYTGGDGSGILRNAGAKWAVTSEDEWYKAAYYMGGGADAGYWDYTTQSNSIDTSMANCGYSVGGTTGVGSYGFTAAYGTYDQGGNVWEWNESVVGPGQGFVWRGNRGGSWRWDVNQYLNASFRLGSASSSWEGNDSGFRVSEVPAPEPSSVVVLAGGLISLLGLKRRRA